MPKPAMRILLVDDAHLLRQILGHAGHVVEVARDGQEALRRVEASRPDLMVLDLMMPVMDGWTVLDRLREMPFSSSSGDRFRIR